MLVSPLRATGKEPAIRVDIPSRFRHPADDLILIPLTDFIANDPCSPEKLQETLSWIGTSHLHPLLKKHKSHALPAYRAFVLETYVKLSVMRFASSLSDGSLFIPPPSTGKLQNGFHYEVDERGNVTFFNGLGSKVAEVDFVCAFYANSSFMPVLFEISYQPHRINPGLKTGLVYDMFERHTVPFILCVYTSHVLDGIVISSSQTFSNRRSMTLGEHGELDEVAEKIWKKDKLLYDATH